MSARRICMTTTSKWVSTSKLHDHDVEMGEHVEVTWPRRRNGSARRRCMTTTSKWVNKWKLHDHDVDMGQHVDRDAEMGQHVDVA